MRHGKREMRKNYTPFAAGMVTMVLLIGLISASFAANGDAKDQSSGGAEPAQIGVGIFLKQQIAPGETLTTEQGGTAPKVLSYADSRGETHYYIEAAAVAELFDVTGGVNFHEEANQLEFGAAPRKSKDGQEDWSNELYTVRERTDFMLAVVTDGKGNSVLTGGNLPSSSGAHTITYTDTPPEELPRIWEKRKEYLQAAPEYGKTGGMFTEVDPAEINIGSLSGIAIKEREYKDPEEVDRTIHFTSRLGKYAAITIENTGASEAEIRVVRPCVVGSGSDSSFTSIYLPAGEKITRAFRIDENKPLENQLQVLATPLGPGGVSVKLTAEQYRSGQ